MQKVKGSFRVRIVVPSELPPHLPPPYTGKKNFIKGLGTGNEREANRLAVRYIADFLGLIEQVRDQAKLIDPWDGEAWQVIGNRFKQKIPREPRMTAMPHSMWRDRRNHIVHGSQTPRTPLVP
jgi:hypothetical protein